MGNSMEQLRDKLRQRDYYGADSLEKRIADFAYIEDTLDAVLAWELWESANDMFHMLAILECDRSMLLSILFDIFDTTTFEEPAHSAYRCLSKARGKIELAQDRKEFRKSIALLVREGDNWNTPLDRKALGFLGQMCDTKGLRNSYDLVTAYVLQDLIFSRSTSDQAYLDFNEQCKGVLRKHVSKEDFLFLVLK